MDGLKNLDVDALCLVVYPDPVLATMAEPVREFGPEVAALARRMLEIMAEAGGVGLAAPQVGLSLRLFVANVSPEPDAAGIVYVNPQIVARQGQAVQEEGCLSCPGISCRIKRSTAVTVQAQDATGRSFQEAGEGLLARAFQHEIDHLNGTLILDRMSSVARLSNRRTIKDLEEEYLARGEP